MIDKPFQIRLTVPARIKSRYPIEITIKTRDPFELLLIAGRLVFEIERRYGMKPEVLILP